MKVVNKKMVGVLVVTLMVIEVCSLFLVCKSFSNKEMKLDEVKLQEKETKEMLAIMVEQEDGTYVESSDSTWPTEGYKYDEEKSGCIDINGNKIENSLTFDGTIATVNTSKSSSCYVYFKIDPLSQIINSSDIWKSTLEDDGYRFIGTDPANYICFGTTDKSTCTANTDKYMYRIIGIFEDETGEQHLKLIKNGFLTTVYEWHKDSSTNIDWDESDLYNGLNGSYFLTNTTYNYMQDASWLNKISIWDYIATNTLTYENYKSNGIYGPGYNYSSLKSVYLHELNKNNKSNVICSYDPSTTADCNIGEWKIVNTKISLMYVSDYLLSLGNSLLDYTSESKNSELSTSWMNVGTEWTMSRYGSTSGGWYSVWDVYAGGQISFLRVIGTASVRPVFYLTNDIKINGSGTSSDPYIIE